MSRLEVSTDFRTSLLKHPHKGNIMSNANPVFQDQEVEQSTKLNVAKIRELYNEILNESTNSSGQLSSLVKVMDLGETKELVVKTMQQISSMSRTKEESSATRFLRKFGMGGLVDKTKNAAQETRIEGTSVSDVSRELLGAVQSKRDRVGTLIENLYDLQDSMRESYIKMKAVVDGIDENWNDYSPREQTQLNILKSEVLETMSYHEDNIVSANGTIKAAEMSMVQISQMIPKLRSQVNDSMAIRGILNELEELTELCGTISDVAGELRSENRETMEHALLNVIGSSVMSDKQLQLIDKNSRRQEEIQHKVANALVDVENRRKIMSDKLQSSTNRNQPFLELDNKNGGLSLGERDE